MYYYTMRTTKHDNSATYRRISEEIAKQTRRAYCKSFPIDKPTKRELIENFYLVIVGSPYICEDCGKEFNQDEEFFKLDNGSIYCHKCK